MVGLSTSFSFHSLLLSLLLFPPCYSSIVISISFSFPSSSIIFINFPPSSETILSRISQVILIYLKGMFSVILIYKIIREPTALFALLFFVCLKNVRMSRVVFQLNKHTFCFKQSRSQYPSWCTYHLKQFRHLRNFFWRVTGFINRVIEIYRLI